MESLSEIARIMRQPPQGETACLHDFPMLNPVQRGVIAPMSPSQTPAAILFPHPVKPVRLSPAEAHAQAIRVLARQGGTCAICGATKPDFRGWQRDHIKSRGQGGTDEDSNIRVVCGRSHSGRHGIREVVASPMWSKNVDRATYGFTRTEKTNTHRTTN